MSRDSTTRVCLRAGALKIALLAAVIGLRCSFMAYSQAPQTPMVLDRVVAVVNRHAILSSDIDEEIRLSVLDTAQAGQSELTRQRALDQLISQTLIQQQIRRDDMQAVEPTQDEVNSRLLEIRRVLPECVHQNCATDEGWKAFLTAHGLTEERVTAYLRYRIEILGFIEQRFRSGIHIPQQDIENYYRNTLVPQYKPGEQPPSLEKVTSRIEEILLQQQVNGLFEEWLKNLRNQGDVEILDLSLEAQKNESSSPDAPAEGRERE